MTSSMRYLWNREAYISLFWLLVMQLIVASSTFFIAKSMQAISTDIHTAYYYMGLFIASLFVVYLPSAISIIYLERWKISAQKRYVLSFTSRNFGKRSLDRPQYKDKHEGWVTTESMLLYDHAPEHLYGLFSTVLNALLAVMVIGVILDISILLWYLLAIFLVIGIKILSKDTLKANAALVQEKRSEVISVLARMWVNTISGSPPTFANWQQSYLKSSYSWKAKTTKEELFLMLISSLSGMLALTFICAGNLLYLMSLSSVSAIAVFMVTLPRQIQIIQTTFQIFDSYLKWIGTAQKLVSLDQHLHLKEEEVNQYIKLQDIRINGKAFHSVGDIKAYIQQKPHGRFTIEGRNGAGKSTLLRSLVEGDKYVFVPSVFRDLEFSSLRQNTASDGESVRQLFDSLHYVKEVDTLYLDEWDASLDVDNKARMHAEVNELSQSKRVIEVVHR